MSELPVHVHDPGHKAIFILVFLFLRIITRRGWSFIVCGLDIRIHNSGMTVLILIGDGNMQIGVVKLDHKILKEDSTESILGFG